MCLFELFHEGFRGDHPVAVGQKFGHLHPVNLRDVQPDGDPTPRPHVGRHNEALGIGGNHRLVLARRDLQGQDHHAVAVVVDHEPGEGSLPDGESGVRRGRFDGDLGQAFAERPQSLQGPGIAVVQTRCYR